MTDAILGLDLSERCTGAVLLLDGWLEDGAPQWERVRTWTGDVPDRSTDHARLRGHRSLARQLRALAEDWQATVVGVEAPAYAQRSTSAHWLAGLQCVVREHLGRDRDSVPIVVASSARKTLLGRCPRSNVKDHVMALLGRLGCPFASHPDLADAFAVANHLSSLEGLPFITIPAEDP